MRGGLPGGGIPPLAYKVSELLPYAAGTFPMGTSRVSKTPETQKRLVSTLLFSGATGQATTTRDCGFALQILTGISSLLCYNLGVQRG